jgi:hypothetical protein
MSNEPNVPGEEARDGERDGTRHIPRDPRDDEGTTATARPVPGEGNEAPDSVNGQLPGGRNSTNDVTGAPGPPPCGDSAATKGA